MALGPSSSQPTVPPLLLQTPHTGISSFHSFANLGICPSVHRNVAVLPRSFIKSSVGAGEISCPVLPRRVVPFSTPKWIDTASPFFCQGFVFDEELTWRLRIEGIAQGHRRSPRHNSSCSHDAAAPECPRRSEVEKENRKIQR